MILPYVKWSPILVPEDSVIPDSRTLVAMNRRKEWAGNLEKLF